MLSLYKNYQKYLAAPPTTKYFNDINLTKPDYNSVELMGTRVNSLKGYKRQYHL